MKPMRPLSQVVPAAVMELLRNTPLSAGKVTFAWKNAVGPALERATSVRLVGTVLEVETAGAQWTREINRSSGVILGRLQGFLGTEAIGRIEVRTKIGN
jgi:hypothetical protein